MSLIDLKAALARKRQGEAATPSEERTPPVRDIEVVNRELGGGAPSQNGNDEHVEVLTSRRIMRRGERHSAAGDIVRTLPHSVEAEMGVLGSMIIDPRRVIPDIRRKGITGEWFYEPRHQIVFTITLEMFSDEGGLDLVTLTQKLRDVGHLEAVGGAAYVTSLFTFVPTAANVEYYAEIVREKFFLREIIAASVETTRRAYEEQDDVNALVEDSHSRITELAGRALAAPSVAVSLIALANAEYDPEDTLLGSRFLCRGAGMIFVGPSGIGKSSASVQQDILWSLGREAFGIRPARPLRILCVQAENDAGDLGEMARGVCDGLGITPAERDEINGRIWYVTESSRLGAEFLAQTVRPLLAEYRPDILRIDPLLAYVGGDVSDQSVTSAFLRHGMNHLLAEFRCAVIINHHTPKVTNRDTSGWRGSDWMYSGAGSADVTNWARAALVIDPTHTPGVFRFHAAKRGTRIGWATEEGEPTFERLFSHSSAGGICWHDASAEHHAQVEASKPGSSKSRRAKSKEDLKALVPLTGEIPKNELIFAAQNNDIGANRARAFIALLIKDEELFAREVPRPRTNPETRISRSPYLLTGE